MPFSTSFYSSSSFPWVSEVASIFIILFFSVFVLFYSLFSFVLGSISSIFVNYIIIEEKLI